MELQLKDLQPVAACSLAYCSAAPSCLPAQQRLLQLPIRRLHQAKPCCCTTATTLPAPQILRGLTRLILGLGELPSPPRQLECEAVNKTSVRLSWQAPEVAGHPLFHKYVLQRQHVHADTGSCAVGAPLSSGSSSCSREAPWELVADPDDELGAWWDAPAIRGTYRYRLAAWSAFGHSAYADSAGTCTVRAVAKQRPAPPPPLVPAEMQAVLAAIAAAGGSNLSAQRAGVGGTAVTWSWSAVSSAVVVGLTILLKASQLRVGARLAALGHLAAATLRGQRAEGGAEGEVLEQQQQQEKQGDAPSAAAGSGMHRVTSSQASLFSLGSEGTAAAEAERHLLQQQQQEVGGLLHSSSRSQLLASPEGSRLYGNAALVYAAQEPGEALDDAAAEVLALAIQRGQHCAHPGCHRRFDRLRDMRRKLEVSEPGVVAGEGREYAKQTKLCNTGLQHLLSTLSPPSLVPLPPFLPLQSHYCGLCQHMHCLAHTRISPHGPRGGCGLESKCVCCACFAELAPAQQAAYERINRLPRPSSTSGNGVAARAGAAVGGDGSGAAGGYSNGQLAAAGLAASSSGICLATLDGPAQEPQAPLTESASAAARQRWRKAGSTLRALVRFKAAGQSAASTPR